MALIHFFFLFFSSYSPSSFSFVFVFLFLFVRLFRSSFVAAVGYGHQVDDALAYAPLVNLWRQQKLPQWVSMKRSAVWPGPVESIQIDRVNRYFSIFQHRDEIIDVLITLLDMQMRWIKLPNEAHQSGSRDRRGRRRRRRASPGDVTKKKRVVVVTRWAASAGGERVSPRTDLHVPLERRDLSGSGRGEVQRGLVRRSRIQLEERKEERDTFQNKEASGGGPINYVNAMAATSAYSRQFPWKIPLQTVDLWSCGALYYGSITATNKVSLIKSIWNEIIRRYARLKWEIGYQRMLLTASLWSALYWIFIKCRALLEAI